MIITCPDCGTRYQADAAKFPAAGRKVKCAKCGHAWHQGPQLEAPVSEPAVAEVTRRPEPARQPVAETVEAPVQQPAAPRVREPEPEPQRPAARVVEPSPIVIAPTPPPALRVVPTVEAPAGPSLWPARLGVVVGWGVLVLLIVAALWAGVRFRQPIVALWPQTSSLYGALGMPVNASGIDFQGISYTREKQDGQSVLAVTGRLVNVSGREESVPMLRAVLSDAQHRELYHWTFGAGVTTMKPGESVKFLTRISSPPPGARHLEVRFARSGE